MTPWRTIDKQTRFEHPVLSLNVVTRQNAAGLEHDFVVLDSPDWVNVVALTSDEKVVLIRQWRQGVAAEALEIPGGLIDPGESPQEAGLRELLEETGYAGDDTELLGWVSPNPALFSNRCYTMLVKNAQLVSAQRLEDTEAIEVLTRPYKDIKRLIASGEINHALVLAAFALLNAGQGKGR